MLKIPANMISSKMKLRVVIVNFRLEVSNLLLSLSRATSLIANMPTLFTG